MEQLGANMVKVVAVLPIPCKTARFQKSDSPPVRGKEKSSVADLTKASRTWISLPTQQEFCGEEKSAAFENAMSLHFFYKSLFFTCSFLPHNFFLTIGFAVSPPPLTRTMLDDPQQ
jgi:hypothetical protein